MKSLAACAVLLFAFNVHAADIAVIGLFPGKAVLVIDGGAPKTYSVDKMVAEGVKLVAVDDSSATIESHGKRQTIPIGGHLNRVAARASSSVTLHADGRGHFIAHGQINGNSVSMLVDTGATMIALSAADATRLGINYKQGKPSRVNTANGQAPAYRVMLDSVKVGDVELTQVGAFVQEAGLPFALLGMSFLSRTEMHNEGQKMTLTKRY